MVNRKGLAPEALAGVVKRVLVVLERRVGSGGARRNLRRPVERLLETAVSTAEIGGLPLLKRDRFVHESVSRVIHHLTYLRFSC